MRSLLFAGATRPDLVAKLPRSSPDGAVIDLEDAVPAADKPAARAALPELVALLGETAAYVRVNAPQSEWFADDLAAVRRLPIAGIVVPKAETPGDLRRARTTLGPGPAIVAGLESARGVADADAILAAGPAAAYFGAEDYIADLGGRRTPDGAEVLFARSRVALAARLAGVASLDQVVVDVRDHAAFERDAQAGRAIGYRGKLCIHPAQVAIANRVFGAGPEEVARARALIAAWEASAARGVAAIAFDGAMVDEPAVRMARDTLARAGEAAR
jgi:citrate lyase subunit beta/citryl-CoA lyase